MTTCSPTTTTKSEPGAPFERKNEVNPYFLELRQATNKQWYAVIMRSGNVLFTSETYVTKSSMMRTMNRFLEAWNLSFPPLKLKT